MEIDTALISTLPPLAENSPCGPDLEYDPEFDELETRSVGKAEQQFGETIIAAEPPDWQAVLALSSSLLARSRDLRVVIHYLRALTNLQGLRGFITGLEMFAALLTQYWEEVHPRLTVDGEFDPLARCFAVSALCGAEGVLKDLRSCELLRVGGAVLSVRDLERIIQNGVSDRGVTREQASLMLGDMQDAATYPTVYLDKIKKLLLTIDGHCQMHLDSLEKPNLAGIVQLVGVLASFCQKARRGQPLPVEVDAGAGAAPQADAAVTPRSNAGVGEISSSQDAERAIRLICEYFERHEPTNPAPLLLRRALKLMSMSFADIIKDLAPDALRQVEVIAGPSGPV